MLKNSFPSKVLMCLCPLKLETGYWNEYGDRGRPEGGGEALRRGSFGRRSEG